MQGISRMRLPMSAKLPAICSILSAKGFGMKCVHASMRIMGDFLQRGVRKAAPAGGQWRRDEASRARQSARATAALRLSSRQHHPKTLGPYATGAGAGLRKRSGRRDALLVCSGGFRTLRRRVETIPHANEGRCERLELLGRVTAGADQALVHGALLALHIEALRREADAHAALVGRVARTAYEPHALEPLE